MMAEPSINNVSPIIESYAMLAHSSRQQAVILKGIDASWASANLLTDNILIGDMQQLQSQGYGILLGSRRAGVGLGDQVEVILPKLSVTPFWCFPKVKDDAGYRLFEVGAQVDVTTAYINQQDARKLFQLGDNISVYS